MLFVLVMMLEHGGYVMASSAFRSPDSAMTAGELWAYAVMKVFAFYLVAFLAGYLSRRVGLLQSFHQNILASFSSGFISVNGDCVVTFINPAASKLLGRAPSESVGEHVRSVLPVAEGQPNPLEESILSNAECQGKEVTIVRADGTRIPIGITISTIKGAAEKLMGAVASFIDLTELKRMEERLRRMDRLAAIGEMSSALAHEIRNPVASIRGAVQEMSDNLDLDGVNRRLMEIAIKESDHLSRVITDFLKFVGTGPCALEVFELKELLEENAQEAKEHLVRNGRVRIVTECPDDLGCITGDRTQLKEAVLNIIRNGIVAMPGGGTLRIGVCAEEEPPGQVSIFVEDQGDGLSPEEAERIFDPFHPVRPGGGVGMEMAIAHRIVASHGGTVDVVSAKGKGTTVTIVLPREG
jgi:two-component system sensor histidine kinase PilS (NtrC family)